MHGQRWRLVLSVSLLGLLGMLVPAWASSTVITTLSEAVLEGETMSLDDVAQVQSDDVELLARLQRVVLGPAPSIGVTRLLSPSTILINLRHQGLAVPGLEFRGARQVRVRRAAQRLSLPELEAAVRQVLSPRLQQLAPSLTIRSIRGLESVSVSPGPVQYEVLTPSGVPRAAALTFTLAIQVAGKVERQLAGRAYLNLPREAIDKTPGAVTETAARHPVAEARNGLTKKPVGQQAARSTAPVVHRGDLVQIVSEAALIKVSTPGEALEPGRPGDTIRVKNTASNREVKAQVIDKHTVRVLL